MISVLLLLLCSLSLLQAAPCGDVNSDGMTNIVDALMIAQFYVGLNPQPFDRSSGDVNGDGKIDIIDALQTSQYYVGLISVLEGCVPQPSFTPSPSPVPTSTMVPTPTPAGMTPGPDGPMLPPNGATSVSADMTLGIVFKGTPKLSGSGQLQLRNSSGIVVETFSGADPVSRDVAGTAYQVNPIQIVGNVVYFLPKNHLNYGETYSVTVDNQMVSDDLGNRFSAGMNDWKFTVRGSKPAQSSTYTVASDGSGDYCTIQGALDALPSGSSSKRVLNIKNGGYPGLVVVEKSNVKFQGEDRYKTILANKNSARMAPGGHVVERMAYLITGSDITFDNLTLWNTFPYDSSGGRQAEAIVVYKDAKGIFINNCEVKSFQDTIMVNTGGQLYIKDSHIWGDIDFIWGTGSIYCEDSELTTHKGGGSITVARNGADTMGFAFVNCKITREESTKTSTLGQTHGYNDGNVAFINCQMGDHITGWKDVSKRDWEYGNTKLSEGSPVKFNGIQLSAGDSNLAKTASAQSWLGWTP